MARMWKYKDREINAWLAKTVQADLMFWIWAIGESAVSCRGRQNYQIIPKNQFSTDFNQKIEYQWLSLFCHFFELCIAQYSASFWTCASHSKITNIAYLLLFWWIVNFLFTLTRLFCYLLYLAITFAEELQECGKQRQRNKCRACQNSADLTFWICAECSKLQGSSNLSRRPFKLIFNWL